MNQDLDVKDGKSTESALNREIPHSKYDTLKRYTPISPKNIEGSIQNLAKIPSNSISDIKQNSLWKTKGKQTDPAFIPTQTIEKSTKFNINYPERSNFSENYGTEGENLVQTLDEYTKSRVYYLDDGTLYFTNGPFYKDEMHKRVDRHHQGN